MIVIKELKDHKRIAVLNEEVQNLHAALYPDIFKPFDREGIELAIERIISPANCRCFIAFEDDVPVGYTVLFVREREESAFQFAGRSLYIDQVCVQEKYRNSGVGAMLLSRAEKFAAELSISRLELDSWRANDIALAYFKKKGYETYKEMLCKVLP